MSITFIKPLEMCELVSEFEAVSSTPEKCEAAILLSFLYEPSNKSFLVAALRVQSLKKHNMSLLP